MANVYSPPLVVHLKKLGGKIIRDCDIYIGNAIRNSSWDLEESKWCDPFHEQWDLTVKERCKKYRDYVTSKPELMRSLSELRGKVLGCLCQSPHSCHGHVLVDLVTRAFSPEEDYCTSSSKGNIYYFKGSYSPCPISIQLWWWMAHQHSAICRRDSGWGLFNSITGRRQ